MAADRKNYVMAVELAMQREMSFREKLKAQGRTLPLQVLTPTSGQAPRTTLGPTPTPNLHLSVGPVSNYVPAPRPYFGPRPVQSPLQRPNSQHHGPITTGSTLVMRPPWFRNPCSRPGPTHQKRKKSQEVEVDDYKCNICEVECNSEYNLRMHFKGQKHKAKLRDGKHKKVLGGISQQGAKHQKYCELCGIWCTDESSFRLHLDGKNHILKLHAAHKNFNF